jgi:hypothetical protein
MPTDNIVLDGTWEQIQNTAQGGYHYVASNPYLTISVLAVVGLVVLCLVVLAIVFIAKANQAQQIQLPSQEPAYKYTEMKTVVTKKPTKKAKRKAKKKK